MDQNTNRSTTETNTLELVANQMEQANQSISSIRPVSSVDEASFVALGPQLAQLSQRLQQSQQMSQLNQQLLQQQGLGLQAPQQLQLAQQQGIQTLQLQGPQAPQQQGLQNSQQLQLAQLLQQQLGQLPQLQQQQALQNMLQPNVLQQQQLLQQQLLQQQLANAAIIQAAMQQTQTPASSRQAWSMPPASLHNLLAAGQGPQLAVTPTVRVSSLGCAPQTSKTLCRGPLLQPHRASSLVTQVRPWSVSGQRMSGTSQASTTVVCSATTQQQQQFSLGLSNNIISNASSLSTGSRPSQSVTSQPAIGQPMPTSLGLSTNQNALQLATLLAAGQLMTPQAIQAAITQLQHQQQLLQIQQQQTASVAATIQPALGATVQPIYFPSSLTQCPSSLSGGILVNSGVSVSLQSPASANNDASMQLAMTYSRLPQVLTQMAMSSDNCNNFIPSHLQSNATMPTLADTSANANPVIIDTATNVSAATIANTAYATSNANTSAAAPTAVLLDSAAAAAAASHISQLIRPSLAVNPNPAGGKTNGGVSSGTIMLTSCNTSEHTDTNMQGSVSELIPLQSHLIPSRSNFIPATSHLNPESSIELGVCDDDVRDVPHADLTVDNVSQKGPQMIAEAGVGVKQTARVIPQILTHIIEGFVIQEGPEPFPIHRSSFLCDSLDSSDELSDDILDDSHNDSINSSRSAVGDEELSIKCAFCGTTVIVPKVSFRATRFCSVSCAKRCAASTRWMVYRSMHGSKGGGTSRRGKGKGSTAEVNGATNINTSSTAATVVDISGSPGKKILEDHGKSPLKSNHQLKVIPTKSPPTNISSANSITSLTCQSPVQTDTGSSHSPGSAGRLTGGGDTEGVASDEILLPASLTQRHPSKWGVSDVYTFVNALPGCSIYANEFLSQEIDGQALLLLKEDHLMSALGLKLGPALKICSQIGALRDSFH